MKYSTKELATIAITASLTVAIGFAFYSLGSILPIPGNKFLIFAPFLGFMVYIPIDKVERVGTVSMVSAVFAFIMGFINIFMALAILLAGVSSDIATLALCRNYGTELKKVVSAAMYPSFSFLWAFVASYYFTGNKLFLLMGDTRILIPIAATTYGLGVAGALMSKNVVKKRIKNAERTR